MANKALWDVGTAFTSLATTPLNSLTTGSAMGSQGPISNGTSKNLLMDISLKLGSINPTGLPYCEIHLLPLSGDGTTYCDRSNETLVGQLQVTTGSSAKVANKRGIVIPPGDFKLDLVNQTGVTFNAANNTLYYNLYDLNLNG